MKASLSSLMDVYPFCIWVHNGVLLTLNSRYLLSWAWNFARILENDGSILLILRRLEKLILYLLLMLSYVQMLLMLIQKLLLLLLWQLFPLAVWRLWDIWQALWTLALLVDLGLCLSHSLGHVVIDLHFLHIFCINSSILALDLWPFLRIRQVSLVNVVPWNLLRIWMA